MRHLRAIKNENKLGTIDPVYSRKFEVRMHACSCHALYNLKESSLQTYRLRFEMILSMVDFKKIHFTNMTIGK